MRRRRFVKALVALALVAALLCGSALAATRSAKVLTSSMSVYSSKGGKRVGSLSHGTSFKVTGISGNWAKISYKGKTGYAKLKDIVFNKHVKMVTKKSSSIRFMTRASYKKRTYYTGTLAAGVTLYVAGINGSYYLFYDESGDTIGYVKKSAVGGGN